MNTDNFRRYFYWGRIIALVFLLFQVVVPSSIQGVQAQSPDPKVYLPLINGKGLSPKMLLGIIGTNWMGWPDNVTLELGGLSEYSGVKLTFEGTFMNFYASNGYDVAVNMELNAVFDQGYTPFINLQPPPNKTMTQIANGDIDTYIRGWATAYKRYVDEKNGIAYIGPFPEMNGQWVSYYAGGASAYKQAMRRVQRIFTEVGVPRNSVRWAFVPNGASWPQDNFEYYYPGDDVVDVVGFSAYNYGYCPLPNYPGEWNPLPSITNGYIDRMRVMAPSKPIFVVQTASSAITAHGVDDAVKNQWFREGLAFLANEPNVRGFIYLNQDDNMGSGKVCDLAMYRTWPSSFSATYSGYRDAVRNNPLFGYLSPERLRETYLTP